MLNILNKLIDIFTLKAIRRYFITGIVIVGPFFLTFYLIYFLVSTFASFSQTFIGFFSKSGSVVANIPALSMIITIFVVIMVGAIARNFFGQILVRATEAIMAKTPLVSAIYSTTKQLFTLISSSQGSSFGKPVLVEYPKEDSWVVGFITNSKEHPKINNALDGNDLRSIFVPTTPNPTSGFMIFIEKEKVTPLDVSVEDAMKLVISAGSIGFEDIKKEKIAKKIEKEEVKAQG